ncbi:MAG TPA: DUF1552 domain-containing protein [Tepidisphaeraceae bacterium]|jgi:hypothetical protein|nr:DUF1552 domain-containing protein [Tepidisphaeraceae bacterium]
MSRQTFQPLSRRTFLRAAGVAMALPFLDSMLPRAMADAGTAAPRRMICICTALGLHAPYFFPTGAGRQYELSPYLEQLKNHRDDFTVVSGLTHVANESAGHNGERTFLTGAHNPELPGFRNSISIDQLYADQVGVATRFPSLVLGTGSSSLSFSRSGVGVPADSSPSKIFAKLFLDGTPDEVQREIDRLNEGRSILDAVGEQAKSLGGRVGAGDRDKLDEYFTSVRDMEKRLAAVQSWSHKPKPRVNVPMPHDVQNVADLIGKMDLLFDLMPLALQTDSTRVVTILIGGEDYVLPLPGVTMGHHSLSHHGQEPTKIEQLRRVETAQMKSFDGLLTKLKASSEAGDPLLKNTTVLFGSNLANASSHSTTHIPVVVAGGHFKHGQHLMTVPKEDTRSSKPMATLFVSMLQSVKVETDTFCHVTGTLSGLDMA